MELRTANGKRRGAGRNGEMAGNDPTRAKLVEIAGRVFAERGYRAATVREICTRAGANVAAVNYYFRDKLGLYTEVLRLSLHAANFERARTAIERNASPEEAFRAVIKLRIQSLHRGGPPDWHFRIVAHELAAPTPAMSCVIQEAMLPLYNRMRDLVGAILGLPPEAEKTRLCVQSVIGQVLIYALAQPVLVQLWPGLKMTSEQLDRIGDHIADFSLAYLREAAAEGGKGRAKQPRARK